MNWLRWKMMFNLVKLVSTGFSCWRCTVRLL